MIKIHPVRTDDKFKDNIAYFAGMIALLIQFVSALLLASFVANEEIRHCKNWMSVTIVTSVIYVICVIRLESTIFYVIGYVLFIPMLIIFKVYELGVVYAFIKESERPGIVRIPVATAIPTAAQSQAVLPCVIAPFLNTSSPTPTAPPQSQVVLPHNVANDLQPYCPEIQDEPSFVEPLLPYYEDPISPVQTDYIVPQVFGPDFPPPYFETQIQRQHERIESPPPSYEEAVWSK
ncbi:unnamed protein product [Orchesella dallaii]|uniref:Uncharacterized protein n=1 Tax=Orchesella dallaii TaxID=48710 RepID=A0ABP1Q3A2_9HEXA